jgi:RES domain-containing protein
MRVWRLCRAAHADTAFSGDGARRYGGRSNSRGAPMVYCSSSLALAAIELFVHLEPVQAPDDLVAIVATLPEGEPARIITTGELPHDWWSDPEITRALGDAWIRSGSSLALKVPSVPIRTEWNVLVNPLHPRMREMKVDAPEPFVFDARMFLRTKEPKAVLKRKPEAELKQS